MFLKAQNTNQINNQQTKENICKKYFNWLPSLISRIPNKSKGKNLIPQKINAHRTWPAFKGRNING